MIARARSAVRPSQTRRGGQATCDGGNACGMIVAEMWVAASSRPAHRRASSYYWETKRRGRESPGGSVGEARWLDCSENIGILRRSAVFQLPAAGDRVLSHRPKITLHAFSRPAFRQEGGLVFIRPPPPLGATGRRKQGAKGRRRRVRLRFRLSAPARTRACDRNRRRVRVRDLIRSRLTSAYTLAFTNAPARPRGCRP